VGLLHWGVHEVNKKRIQIKSRGAQTEIWRCVKKKNLLS